MQLRFTVANLLLLTVIAAMGAQLYRAHVRFQELTAELTLEKARRDALHRAVRDVKQCELELQAAMEQLSAELPPHQRTDFAGPLRVSSASLAIRPRVGTDFLYPASAQRLVAQVRRGELRVIRAREYLQRCEQILSQTKD